MEYQPKVLINNTDHDIEFSVGGDEETGARRFIFKPGEQRILEGYDAYHALHVVNTGLTEVGFEPKVDPNAQDLTNLEDLTWNQLRRMVGKDGNKVYRTGMDLPTLIDAIRKANR